MITRAALLASLALAGGVHLAVAGDHGGTHGVFLLVAGLAQLGLAVAVARGAGRSVLPAVVVVSGGVAAVWAADRLAGVIGGVAQPIGLLDAACTVLEAGAVVAALRLASHPVRTRNWSALPVAGAAMAAAVALALPAGAHAHVVGDPAGHAAHTVGVASDDPFATTQDSEVFGDLFAGHGSHAGESAP